MSNLEFDPFIMLNYASDVTERMNAAKTFKEMATVFSDAISFEINKDKKYQFGSSRACDYMYGDHIYFEIPGGIEDKHKLEYLIAEFTVTCGYTVPTSGEKKRYEKPSFAFFVAALSVFPAIDTMEENFRQICRSAYNLALDLSTAAIAASHADTLRDMERGIRAVKELGKKSTTTFSRHVHACLIAHRNLIEAGCAIPTKGHVRDGATKILKGWGFSAFDDSAHWRQVYQAAGMKDLPQARPGRS